jgi:hypothetical protein
MTNQDKSGQIRTSYETTKEEDFDQHSGADVKFDL